MGLRDIQRDLAGMVDQQGEDIDRIGMRLSESESSVLASE